MLKGFIFTVGGLLIVGAASLVGHTAVSELLQILGLGMVGIGCMFVTQRLTK